MQNKFKIYLKHPAYIIASGLIVCMVTFMIFSSSCSKKDKPGTSELGAAVPVTVAVAEQKNLPVEIGNLVGTVEAYASVTIKSQVTGVLNDVNFIEGQSVRKGDLLLMIDPRPSEAALRLAQANLAKDDAQLKNAMKEFDRQSELLKKGFASQNDYDNSLTAVDALRASINADKAAADNAALQLEYCSIRSPIDGIVGSLLVDKGNLIKSNDVTVVSVNQISPIYVSFSVRQEYLPQIQKYYYADSKLKVIAKRVADDPNTSYGYLSFIDNAINTNTGTIRLRATFENENRNLWPGQFVNVTMTLTNEPNAISIPSEAVQVGQSGQYVYIVKADKTVESRNIKVKRIGDDYSVVDGLKAGETVVTDGQLRLVPGAKVEIKNQNNKQG